MRWIDRFLRSNTLHRDQAIKDSRLKRLVLEHTKYYRDKTKTEAEADKTSDFKDEILHFIDNENSIIEATTYVDWIEELFNRADFLKNNEEYLEWVSYLRVATQTYLSYRQVDTRLDVVYKFLKLLEKPKEGENYLKVIAEYKAAENKEQFIREQRFTNITPYSEYELIQLRKELNIEITTNMIFSDKEIVKIIMEFVRALESDLRTLIMWFQWLVIDMLEHPGQLEDAMDSLLDIKNLLTKATKIQGMVANMMNNPLFTPDDIIDVSNVKRLIEDLAFIKDSYKIKKRLQELDKDISDGANKLSQNGSVLDHFKKQLEDLNKIAENDYTDYIKDADGNKVEIGDHHNQYLAEQRDKLKDQKNSINDSINDWIKDNPYDGLSGLDRIVEVPGSLKYLEDKYKNSSSNFDENFRNKVIEGIGNLINNLKDKLKNLLDFVNKNLAAIAGLLGLLLAKGAEFLQKILDWLNKLKCKIKAVLCAIGKLLGRIINSFKKLVEFLGGRGGLDNIVSGIRTLPGRLMKIATKYATKIYEEVKAFITAQIDNIKNLIGGADGEMFKAAYLKAMAKCGANAIGKITDLAIGWATEQFSELVDMAKNALSGEGQVCPRLMSNSIPDLGFQQPSFRFDRPNINVPSLQTGNC